MGAVTFSIDLRLVECLKRALPLDIFVETGTFEGDTLESVHSLFTECHSVELSETNAAKARARFAELPAIHVQQGESPAFLKEHSAKFQDASALYWLDAHWCVGNATAGQTSQCPLLQELEAIGRLNDRSVILIDDARFFLCPPPKPHEVTQWPQLQEILNHLREISPRHRLMVVNDVFVFFPTEISGQLSAFAHTHGVDWLVITHKFGQFNIEAANRKAEEERERLAIDEGKEKLRKAKEKQRATQKKLDALEQKIKERSWWRFFGSKAPQVEQAVESNPQPPSPVKEPAFGIDAFQDIETISKSESIKVVFDVGANEGQTMKRLAARFPGAAIHCFEPFPEAFAQLQKNAGELSQVRAHQLALGERDGLGTLFLSKASVTNSLLPVTAQAADFSPPGWTEPAGQVDVSLSTLDTFCANEGVDRIDLLKIDAQGYELQIIKGASRMLGANKIAFVYLELIFVPLYEGQASFEAIYAALTGHGYSLVDLYEKDVHGDRTLRWCNGLFKAPAGPAV